MVNDRWKKAIKGTLHTIRVSNAVAPESGGGRLLSGDMTSKPVAWSVRPHTLEPISVAPALVTVQPSRRPSALVDPQESIAEFFSPETSPLWEKSQPNESGRSETLGGVSEVVRSTRPVCKAVVSSGICLDQEQETDVINTIRAP